MLTVCETWKTLSGHGSLTGFFSSSLTPFYCVQGHCVQCYRLYPAHFRRGHLHGPGWDAVHTRVVSCPSWPAVQGSLNACSQNEHIERDVPWLKLFSASPWAWGLGVNSLFLLMKQLIIISGPCQCPHHFHMLLFFMEPMLVHFMCQLDWATECPDSWSNDILGFFEGVFWMRLTFSQWTE